MSRSDLIWVFTFLLFIDIENFVKFDKLKFQMHHVYINEIVVVVVVAVAAC